MFCVVSCYRGVVAVDCAAVHKGQKHIGSIACADQNVSETLLCSILLTKHVKRLICDNILGLQDILCAVKRTKESENSS